MHQLGLTARAILDGTGCSHHCRHAPSRPTAQAVIVLVMISSSPACDRTGVRSRRPGLQQTRALQGLSRWGRHGMGSSAKNSGMGAALGFSNS